MAKEHSLAAEGMTLGGADYVRIMARLVSLDTLEEALELALRKGPPRCSKTLVATLEREIRRKKKTSKDQEEEL
jgi:hypothetical protein